MDVQEESKRRAGVIWEALMLVLALASILLIALVEIRRIQPGDPGFWTIAVIDLALVIIFAVEFIVRAIRSQSPARFVRENWMDVIGLVPLILESWSWFRVLRLARLARLIRLLRTAQLVRRARGTFTFLDTLLLRSRLGQALSVAALIILAMATVVWMLERDTNEAFASFGDSLWWAVVTVTTVGYGDITPQTGMARIVAGVLMLLGIGVIAMVTSSLSAAMLTAGTTELEPLSSSTAAVVEELERLARLRDSGHLNDEEFTAAKRRVLAA